MAAILCHLSPYIDVLWAWAICHGLDALLPLWSRLNGALFVVLSEMLRKPSISPLWTQCIYTVWGWADCVMIFIVPMSNIGKNSLLSLISSPSFPSPLISPASHLFSSSSSNLPSSSLSFSPPFPPLLTQFGWRKHLTCQPQSSLPTSTGQERRYHSQNEENTASFMEVLRNTLM